MSADRQASLHPSPARGRVGVLVLLSALFGGPAAWIVQLVVNYGLSALACFPNDEPLSSGWTGVRALLGVINVAALLAALLAALTSFGIWRRTRGERPGSHHELIEVGEGRTRFLALCGVLTGLGFLLAIGFNTVALVSVPLCFG